MRAASTKVIVLVKNKFQRYFEVEQIRLVDWFGYESENKSIDWLLAKQ